MTKILTVDDSPSIRQMVRLTLTRAGHAVVEAGNGAEGLARVREQQFDLVITDLNMPVMNGLDMITALRGLPNARGVPIVFLTTESDPALKQRAKAAGATAWITKPFTADQLLSLAGKLVRQ